MKRVLKTCLIISTSEDLVISGTDEAVIVFVSEREREMDRDVVNGGGRLRDGRRKQDMKRLWRKTDRKGVRDYKMERD